MGTKKYRDEIDKLYNELKSKKLRVPIKGINYKNKIMFVLQNPRGFDKKDISNNPNLINARNYNEYHEAWIDVTLRNNNKTVNRIKKFLSILKLTYDDIFYTNIVKTPKKSLSQKDAQKFYDKEIYEEKPIILWEIEKFKPEIIILFGSITHSLFYTKILKTKPKKIRECWHTTFKGKDIFSMSHPAARVNFNEYNNKALKELKQILN